MSVNAVDQTTGNTTPLAGNTNNLVGNLSALTTNTKSDAVGAINEVNQTKQNATDNNLQTTDKTIVGGINELRSGLIGHSQTSGAPVDVDGTLQLNENVLSHGLILISMGRYSYESTFIAFKSRIEADAYSHATLYIDGTRNVSFTLSTTGLLTIAATSAPVNITVWGVL